jgi:hydroxypyruvate isomerase
MRRREFLRAGIAAVGGTWASGSAVGRDGVVFKEKAGFRLNYAPHFGMFKHSAGDDLICQLNFAAEHGFTAWEDSGLKNRPVDLQNTIARAMEAYGLKMGAVAAVESFQDVTFARKDRAAWQRVLRELRESVEAAKRVHAKWLTVVPGRRDEHRPWTLQTAHCIELLQRCCDVVEPAGLVLVLEPMNGRAGHTGCLLQSVPQAYRLCRAVDRSSCKVLLDCYHQQPSADGLIRLIDAAWNQIAYIQCGDRPGRKEPGTGDIEYRRVFRHLQQRGYCGIVGMEHGNSRPGVEGERAVIEAYASADC